MGIMIEVDANLERYLKDFKDCNERYRQLAVTEDSDLNEVRRARDLFERAAASLGFWVEILVREKRLELEVMQ